MAEQQKIHPVDVEAGAERPTPTAPLVPRGAALSEKGDTEAYPPQHRAFPVSHSRPPRTRRSCCLRCVCWSLCAVVALVFLLGATAGVLYLVYRPKLPVYSVDSLRISEFTIGQNDTVTASFIATVTAENPNGKIGIYYVDGSHLRVLYEDRELCEGTLPVFYQGHHNTTVLNVTLTGERQLDDDLMAGLQADRQAGAVPLKFRAKVPVRVKFGGLKLFKIKPLVRCTVVVSSLEPNLEVSIKSTHCKFKFRF